MKTPPNKETPTNPSAAPIPGELDDQALEQVSGGLLRFQPASITLTPPVGLSPSFLLGATLGGTPQESSLAASASAS